MAPQLSGRAEKIKKAVHVPSAFQLKNRHFRPMLVEAGNHQRCKPLLERPDVSQELPVRDALQAPGCHVGPGLAEMKECAFADPPQAEPTRHADPHDQLGARDTEIESGWASAVHQPTPTGDNLGDQATLLVLRALDPTREPEKLLVHREIRKVEPLADLSRQGAFAATGAAD